MSDQVLYRKYRPQKFEDVLGQEHIVKVLQGALKLGNLSHAYLFSGSRGTGKTSVARIVAREIGASDNDTLEIDAASNRGIDDIRQLREAVRTMPFDSKYKVYIVDEVHMLTKEAFNALLKTLEEPPEHVIFILATTELEKVPDTIISRCQTFVFKKPSEAILKEFATNISLREGYKLEPQASELVAVLGDGSFRDTHGILQKIFSFPKEKKITSEMVEEVTGAPSLFLIHEFIESIWKKDLEKGIESIEKAVSQNIDMQVFLKLILHRLRIVFLLRYLKNLKEIDEHFDKNEIDFLKKVANEQSEHINSKTLVYLLDAYQNIRYSFITQLPVEIALVKILEN